MQNRMNATPAGFAVRVNATVIQKSTKVYNFVGENKLMKVQSLALGSCVLKVYASHCSHGRE